MWICQKCQTQNREGVQACPVCGTMRAAGRFGSAPQQRPGVSAPRVTAAAAAPQMQEPVQSGINRSGYQPPEDNMRAPRAVRGKGGGFVRFVGISLCVLLPTLTLLMALVLFVGWQSQLQTWQQMIKAYPQTASMFIGSYIPVWLGWVFYGILTFTALLLSLLPGLWTLLLNRRK